MERNIKIGHLFCLSRFPEGLALFFLPFYIPLGIVVMVVRIFFALQLYLVLTIVPKTWFIRRLLLRISGALCGLIVTQEGLDLISRTQCKMVISNHITHVDSLAFESLLPFFMNPDKNGIPSLLRWILKYDEIKPGDTVPSLVFAEGSTTNGNTGLLKFSSWPFDSKNEPFAVAVITISRPYFVQIAPSVLGGHWWSDFLWILFSPYTHFKIRFLQPPDREDGSSNEDYSTAVQKFMAGKLGVCATKFDVKDKMEFIKRYFHEQSPRRRETARSETAVRNYSGNEVLSMVTQVKSVLPQVPVTAIKKDLMKTKCVDATISNILEGKVVFAQETPPGNTVEKERLSKNVPTTKTSAKTFSKDSVERHLSFQERKKAFIEAARQKYIAKHNLDVL